MPVPIFNTDNRVSIIYIFGCLEDECGSGKGNWRVFRWTEKVEETTEAKPPPSCSHPTTASEETHIDSSHHSGNKDAWGLDCTEGGNDSFDFAELEAQVESLHVGCSSPPQGKERGRDAGQVSDRQTSIKNDTYNVRHNENTSTAKEYKYPMKPLPAFYMVESTEMERMPRDDGSDDDHPCSSKDAGIPNGVSLGDLRGGGGDESEALVEGGIATWDGEGYEADAVLHVSGRDAPDAPFLKFMKHLSDVPDQCARIFHVGVGGIWPVKDVPGRSATCSHCGSSKEYVCQLLSPLIAALDDCAGYLTEDTAKNFASAPLSWDWACIGIQVCRAHCLTSSVHQLVEESIEPLGDA